MSVMVDCDADPALPTLARVRDPRALGRILAEIVPPHGREFQDLQVRVLRYHPGKRCAFEIAWRSADGPHALIGKVYAADRSEVYQAMAAIRRAGFGPDAEFSIPEPVAYLPDLRLLLQEKVAGPSATELLVSDEEDDRRGVAERCARWLARLHAAAPRPGLAFDLSIYRLSIQRWSRRIAGVGGACADKAGQLSERLEGAASRIRDVGRCACHGSFTHHQVIAASGRTVTFDWDDHVWADPGYDVARFVVGLRRLALRCLGSIRALDGVADVFLTTYLASFRPEVRDNLAFYAASICLRLAKKDVRHQAARWPEKAKATLAEGLRVLEQGV